MRCILGHWTADWVDRAVKFVEEAVKTENQKLIFVTPPDCLHGDGVHWYEFNEARGSAGSWALTGPEEIPIDWAAWRTVSVLILKTPNARNVLNP